MRSNATRMFGLWNDPTFQPIGDNKARAIVTCEPDWFLSTQATGLGAWPADKAPVRYFQRADNSQVEEEIPNIKAINWERSIESDAASCTITLTNQWMDTNFTASIAGELGQPGFFTFNRGDSTEAAARWQHTANSWRNKIVPGALLRTYQGYGGFHLDRAESVADGYLMLTGCWIVDDVVIGAKSHLIELRCRDMGALLIDQMVYPPLIPPDQYPLRFSRWFDTTTKSNYTPKSPSAPSTTVTVGSQLPAQFVDSAVDRWYPQAAPGSHIPAGGFILHGRRGAHSIDGRLDTYALSVGNSGPDRPFSTNWWEYGHGGASVGEVRVITWRGPYTMYVSVMENGRWQGGNRVPYDHTPLIGTQPYVVDTGADIPYVSRVAAGADAQTVVRLPRVYRAQRIRISFRGGVDSGIGPWVYRSGLRAYAAYAGTSTTRQANARPYGWRTIEAHPTLDGYWTLSYEGKVDAFGHCVHHGDRFSQTTNNMMDLISTPTGDGYWLLNHFGQIAAFGDAVHYGDHYSGPSGLRAAAMARTHTGAGYWILMTNGTIFNFGDAPPYAAIPSVGGEIPVDFTAMLDGYGFWVLTDNGRVYRRGAAPDYGQQRDYPDFDDGHGQDITVSGTGNGFMTIGIAGWTGGFGDVDPAAPYGTPRVGAVQDGWRPAEGARIESVVVNAANDGYWAINTVGDVYTRGSANRWGSPNSAITIRRDGNYLDYTDIVKDLLLWSGWWLKEDIAAGGVPEVFGNLETTGIYSPDPLPVDMFDKRPPIDAIKQLREIVGYLSWVDDEGAFRFTSPNWWQAGNYLDDGVRTMFIPEVDERVQLTDYQAGASKQKERSEIILSTNEPTAGFTDTVTTRFKPPQSWLRGMVVPAMVRLPPEVTADEQRVMAELIGMHLWFARRTGQVTMLANPAITIDDQIRVFERVTAESYIHYVRGVSSNHEVDTGRWTMTLTTNWLGTEDGTWAIRANQASGTGGIIEQLQGGGSTDQFVMSPELAAYIDSQVKNTQATEPPVFYSPDIDAPVGADGSGPPP